MRYYLKNMTNAILSLSIPEISFRRTLSPNRQLEIDEKIVKELNYDAGAADMLEKGVFIILTEDDLNKNIPVSDLIDEGRARGTNEELGTNHIVLSQDEATKIVKSGNIIDFTNAIKEGTYSTRQNLKEAVITLQKLDPVYIKLVKEYCGVDILKAASLKSQMIENTAK